MKKFPFFSLIRFCLIGVLGYAMTFSVSAQDEDNDEAETESVEELIVTGSRIVRVELEGSSPVQVFDRIDIERSGETSLGELLREMPSVAGGAQTTQINNGGDGTNRISLRGIGSGRTLVLMNGRRLPSSTSGLSSTNLTGAVDLNTIPVTMVDRIEVFKDGASAIYGSDAVGGVVNILTRRGYDGVQVNYQHGVTSRGDGIRTGADLTFGGTGEDSSFLVFGSYVNEGTICACDRDWANTPYALFGGDVIFLGSSAPPWGRYRYSIDDENFDVTRGPEYGEFRPFDFFGGDSYNFAPSNHQRQPNRRWSVAFSGDRMVNDLPFLGDARFSLEMSYLNRDSDQRLAEVPLAPLVFFGYNAPYTADNYYNPFGAEISDWRRRMVEGGSRFENTLTETKRVLVGLDGELGNWDYDMYATFGETASEGHFGHIYNLERVANAVGPSLKDGDGNWVLDADGNPLCANDTDACVPLNVFSEGSVTQEMIDYITFVDNQASLQDQKALALNFVNSDIVDLPAGPLGVAFGYEWREERGSDTPDSQVNALGSAATGTPRKPTSGGFSVKEIYSEMVLPLLGDNAIADSVELNLATRYSSYDPFGDTTNSNVGLKWRVSDQFMGRMKFSQAFRAPSTSHLFGGSGFSFPSISDPCSTNPTSFCIADGVPAGGFEPLSTQIRTTVGGNMNAQPETADIFTYGFVYEPNFVPGLAITIDHYDIELTNALATLGADFIVESCAESGSYCDLIERIPSGPNAGNPINVLNTVRNVGGLNTSGWDIGARYLGLDLLGGTFDFRFEATRLSDFETVQADGSVVNLTGRFDDDQDGHFTKLRYNFDVVYNRNSLSLSWQLRSIGDADEVGFDFATGADVERILEGRNYHDLQASYDFTDLDMIIAGGIDNVLDEDPPLSLDGFNDNTDVRTFDTAGRYYFLKVTLTR